MKQTPDFAIPTTSDYAVFVGGHSATVYAMPTRYGQTLENNKPVSVYDGAPLRQPMYFACADIGGPTLVTVEIGFLNADDIRSVTAHPLSRGIEVRREGARVTFDVDRPGTVTLLVNGDHRDRPLHLFFSPPVEAPPAGAIVFGPGYHGLGYDNPITLTDGQTLYLAPGAWVEGIVRATGARNIRIMGRGVLSQRRPGKLDYAGGETAPSGIVLANCQDIAIEGIVETRGIGGWCSLVTTCDRVDVRDYHVLASVVWSADGFNPCNSRDVTVERCFIRSGDDCIAIKGNTGGSVLSQPHIPPETQPPVENIHVRQSVFWCDHNEVFVIGCETRARHIRNVSIRDCDVLFHWSSMDMGVFGIIPLHGTEIRDIVYDDIRVEHCEEHLFFFRFCESIWSIPGDLTFPGTVADITIRNVSVLHAATGPRSEISGYAPDKRFEHITIENLRYGGKPVSDAAGMGLRVNEHVAEIRFVPATACTGTYIEELVTPGPSAVPEWRFAEDTPLIGQTMPETIARVDAAVRAAEPVAATDPLRPVFHFRPPAQWMNDICGALWHEGWYHIFYQFNPFADRCDWSGVNACWGHARSRDLVHWEPLPIAVAPSVEEGNYQCASGCATHRADGTPMLFYGHTPQPRPDGTRPPRQQWAALPLDPELRTWQTLDVGLAPGQSGVPADIAGCWTDMFVFREAGRTFAIFKEAGGLVVEAQNPELTRWQAIGRIDGVFGECPNFIKLQDRWLLLRSTYPMTYQVGRFNPERIAFETDGPAGIVDYSYGLNPSPDPADPNYYLDASGVPVCRYGAPSPAHTDSRGFYATSTFADPAGRMLLLAWVGAWPAGRGWNCCMSLPRVLSFDAAGRLVQQPIPELAQLRGAAVALGPLTLYGEARRIEGFTGDTLEVEAEFDLGSAEAVELALCDETGTDAVRIRYDGQALDANDTVLPRVLSDDPCHIKLHLFFDRSVMELFINDGLQTVTRVAIPPSPALHLEVGANGGAAVMRSLTVWPICSLGGDTVALLHNPNPEQDAPATLDNQQMEKFI